jgi:hypothetical protein
MVETTQTAIHPDFPRWYREVDLEENRDRIQRRWNGVSALIPTINKHSVESLLRVVFHSKAQPNAENLASIRKAFKDADDLFDMGGNDRELEILCGSVLAVLLDSDNALAAWSALATTTSFLDGHRALNLPQDLVSAAENAITRAAEKNRTRPVLNNIQIDVPKLNFAKAKEKFQPGIDPTNLSGAFDVAAETVTGGLIAIVSKVNEAIKKTAGFISIQDEELEMLWWVLGERSSRLNTSFRAVPKHSKPLVFGGELAEATVSLPGPLSILGLLVRAGLKDDDKISLKDAVNKADTGWLKLLTDGKTFSPLSQPIHLAFQKRLETGDDDTWVSGWAGSCGLDVTASMPSLTMGNLFYRECLLSRF